MLYFMFCKLFHTFMIINSYLLLYSYYYITFMRVIFKCSCFIPLEKIWILTKHNMSYNIILVSTYTFDVRFLFPKQVFQYSHILNTRNTTKHDVELGIGSDRSGT